MSESAIEPGQVWKAKALTADYLVQQWEATLHHHSANPDLISLSFSRQEWDDWEWNAQEALYLNRNLNKAPALFRHWFLPQQHINFHLLHSFEKMVLLWRQWAELPQVRSSDLLAEQANVRFLLQSANGRIDQAMTKYESLAAKGKILQNVSLRQHRFFQQLTALLQDMVPVVLLARRHGEAIATDDGKLEGLERDICWHSKELLRLVGHLDHCPELVARIRVPRLEINRLLGTVCLYQARFLRTLIELQTA